MKSREDFKTKADFKEYLFQVYSPICLQSVGNSGLLGGTSPYIAAVRMARDMVEAVVPEDMAIPHPMKDNGYKEAVGEGNVKPTQVEWISGETPHYITEYSTEKGIDGKDYVKEKEFVEYKIKSESILKKGEILEARLIPQSEVDKIIESNKKWEEEQRKKFETGFSEVFLTNPNNNFIGNDAEVDFPVCCTSIPIIERMKG